MLAVQPFSNVNKPLSPPTMLLSIASLIGAALIVVGALLAFREHTFLQKAQISSGKVTGLVVRTQNRRRTSYSPRVEFTTPDGSTHEFVSNYSSNPAPYNVGDTVPVAYGAQSFDGRILTFGQRFGLASMLVIFGCALLAARLVFAIGDQYIQRVYMPHGGSQKTVQTS